MALKGSMRSLLNIEWTSMMVENSRKQERISHLHDRLIDNASVGCIMDYSQTWHSTPQGRPYWKQIALGLDL